MYENLKMEQRIDRIGELLAKAVYLCVKDQSKEEGTNNEEKQAVNNYR